MNKKNTILVDLLICFFILLVVFFKSINRDWIFYDESLITSEIIAPIPHSTNEIFEIIKTFGIFNNFNSTNLLYSSNSVNRVNFLGIPYYLIIGFLFKKNAVLYHLLSMFFHVLNTVLVYILFSKVFINKNNFSRFILIFTTCIWAIHPVQIEAVLLATNIPALFSYFIFLLLFLDFLNNEAKKNNLLRFVFIFCTYFLTMLLNENIIMLPLILTLYSFLKNYDNKNIGISIRKTFYETLPYTISFLIYTIYFFLSKYSFIQANNEINLIGSLERIIWLSPQIFLHYLKLIFFPSLLSIDQSAHVRLGESLFDTYSLFCILFTIAWIILPSILYFFQMRWKHFAILNSLFYLSLIPFMQILSPTYCLCAERYLYIPLFVFVFFILNSLNKIEIKNTIVFVLLGLIVLILGYRSFYRVNDWKNNETFISSLIKTSPNELYKGARKNSYVENVFNGNIHLKESNQLLQESENHFFDAISFFKTKKNNYPNTPTVLKLYGLDYDSLILKCIHYISYKVINNENESIRKYILLFSPYINSLNIFMPDTLEIYGNLLFKNQEFNDAKKIFEYAHKCYPTNASILVSLIRYEREKEKNYVSSKEYLKKALNLYPYSKYILLEALNQAQAEQNIEEYLKYSYLYGLRTHSESHFQSAFSGYLALNNLEKAKTILEKLNSDNPISLYLLSIYYIKIQDYNKAKNLLLNAQKIIKNDSSVDKQISDKINEALLKLN